MIKHCGTKPIETPRLLLRRFQPEDMRSMQRNWISDPVLQSLYSAPVYETDEEVSGLLAKITAAYGDLSYYRWAVISKDSGDCIGQIAISLIEAARGLCEIEYCIGRDFQNRGLATEATMAVIDFAFNHIGFDLVRIWHKEDNLASKRVIEKCGCSYDGTSSNYFCLDDCYIDLLYYSIAADQWKNRRPAG